MCGAAKPLLNNVYAVIFNFSLVKKQFQASLVYLPLSQSNYHNLRQRKTKKPGLYIWTKLFISVIEGATLYFIINDGTMKAGIYWLVCQVYSLRAK